MVSGTTNANTDFDFYYGMNKDQMEGATDVIKFYVIEYLHDRKFKFATDKVK
jgi:hypothetical protein